MYVGVCVCADFGRSVQQPLLMSPSLARSAPSELNHWWSQLRFRLQNKKGWNEMLDETFLLYTKKYEKFKKK